MGQHEGTARQLRQTQISKIKTNMIPETEIAAMKEPPNFWRLTVLIEGNAENVQTITDIAQYAEIMVIRCKGYRSVKASWEQVHCMAVHGVPPQIPKPKPIAKEKK